MRIVVDERPKNITECFLQCFAMFVGSEETNTVGIIPIGRICHGDCIDCNYITTLSEIEEEMNEKMNEYLKEQEKRILSGELK